MKSHRAALRLRYTLLVGFITLVWSHPALARPPYVGYVPTPFGCETCHDVPDDRTVRNIFGIHFAGARAVWAYDDDEDRGVCGMDSDGDGLTNGEELGDPDCLWRRGDPLPDHPATHPADPRDPDRCANGAIDPGEECDGAELGDAMCEDLGFTGGVLGCSADCEFDTTACVQAPAPDAGDDDAGVTPEDAQSSDTDVTEEDTAGGDTADAQHEDAPAPDIANPDIPMEEDAPEAAGAADGGCHITAQSARAPWVLFGLCLSLLCLRRVTGLLNPRTTCQPVPSGD